MPATGMARINRTAALIGNRRGRGHGPLLQKQPTHRDRRRCPNYRRRDPACARPRMMGYGLAASIHPTAGLLSAVNLAPVTNFHHQHPQSAILNVANDAAVANAITPESAQWPAQRLAGTARIIHGRHPYVHEIDNAPRCLLVELEELFSGRVSADAARFSRPGELK